MADKYTPQEIERKWQAKWAEDKLYEVRDDDPRPKWYALTMFPYTSGDLHVGHWYAMAPSDVHARFKRMQGYNVLHPMGFDAFGLPAENAAIKRGIHPRTWTMQNIENMRRQLKSLGAIYDWDREVITCDPDYYRWTQWFFVKLFEHDLAYRGKAQVNWCPKCQVVLANEQVVGGLCWRCDTEVVRRDLEQWLFRITRYADELMQHEDIDWPERIKTMQRNWVGKSYGTEISFGLDHPGVAEKEIRIFTTRPDTTYGVTFFVLAPEHPLAAMLTAPERRAEVQAYVDRSRRLTDIERLSTEKEKDGVFTGAYVTNRLNGEKVPVWIADYVLATYGTGAVMAVPAHDERDFAFAKSYGIPIRVVIAPPDWKGEELDQAYIEPGTMVNSGQFNGTSSEKGMAAVTRFLEEKGWGKGTVSYRMRDWIISRQRYWGAPIPMVHCPKCGIVAVPEKDLPVLLPDEADFSHVGESPLKYDEKWVNTTCPKCGGAARRETDTIDGFMCSCWYFLRYCSPHYDKAAFDPQAVKHWMPVDIYTGGAEHAVMHLLYTRFFTMAIRDMGLVDFGEPFGKLFNQGTIIADNQKMSKSRGNVVNPDEYVNDLGADTVRAYMMFIGPWDQGGDWSDTGISGISRWFNRVWSLALEEYKPGAMDEDSERALRRLTHQTIRRVTNDIDRMRFNTMLAALMEFSNELSRISEAAQVSQAAWKEAISTLILLLAPSAPHLAEELWARTGHEYSIHNQRGPKWDETLAKEEEITLVVQVNGKVRDRLTVPASVTEADAKAGALASEKVKAHLEGKQIANVVYVAGRLVNVVVR
ncbi:MAG: leucine--tRNA ligase [Chloroflexi bacterium RBG_16_57_8]|nr:MAG: leucine--tRNA ligase [Chloroflexi bacterium RBG_16_57_8]